MENYHKIEKVERKETTPIEVDSKPAQKVTKRVNAHHTVGLSDTVKTSDSVTATITRANGDVEEL